MKFHENPPSGSHADTCGLPDRQADMAKQISPSHGYGNTPKNEGSHTSAPPICLHGLDRDSFSCTFYVINHLRIHNLDLWKQLWQTGRFVMNLGHTFRKCVLLLISKTVFWCKMLKIGIYETILLVVLYVCYIRYLY